MELGLGLATGFATLVAAKSLRDRLQLSWAKHPSLLGHPRIALRLARFMPAYEYDEQEVFCSDGAPPEVAGQRRESFLRLSAALRARAPKTLAASEALTSDLSDVAFTNAYRVPFQYRRYVANHLPVGTVVEASEGSRVRDLDGNWDYDLGGSYGVNLFGVEFYKGCIERGVERAKDVGLVLGPYHPVIADNVRRLKALSGMDEVSFHMSGTEAVMQAVRLARYHTRRSHAVRFCGAYHGWGDVVQAGPGNPRPQREIYTLAEMSDASLRVLNSRRDIACVLVNPLQAMSPNSGPAADSSLIASDRRAHYDKDAYARWLGELRAICTKRGIALIFDEVFLGFRLALGGAQEFFGIRADLVTYGKTLGGGLPVGVLCGRRDWTRRFRDQNPADICFARGTFNSHPYVMATMNEFLTALETPTIRATYDGLEALWNARRERLNAELANAKCPVRVENMVSVWTTLYTEPSRYNWMFQYYLRAQGLQVSWIGSGRFIFSHATTHEEFAEICKRFVAAATAMKADGWWWSSPALTNKSIKRQVLYEALSAFVSRPQSDQTARPSADVVAPHGT
jgi:glutamate-1-semialdehyde 2,1-aminomutase